MHYTQLNENLPEKLRKKSFLEAKLHIFIVLAQKNTQIQKNINMKTNGKPNGFIVF